MDEVLSANGKEGQMSHLVSLILYGAGDIVSRSFLARFSLGGWIYHKLMGWSVFFDKNCEIWKEPEDNE
ncbi:MAG: hypothetical protein EBT82_03890 [Micrococcales bacterium]|nr:hypothetical protein [Micrococcales bacterium]